MASLWQRQEPPEYPAAQGEIKTQVAVVGGGMAGILCAWRLHRAGIPCVVVEAEKIGGGVTARTTAVVSAQHDTLYQDLVTMHGEAATRAWLHANLQAVAAFREAAGELACEFETLPSMQYTLRDPERLRREAETLNRLGYGAVFTNRVPLDLGARGAVVYPDMAQFHPLEFLYAAARELTVYEHSRVLRLEGTTLYTAQARISAAQVVIATHFPLINRRGMHFMKLYQQRSYVLALENAPDPGCTLAQLEPNGLYFRRAGELLLVGGGSHRTGARGGGFAGLRRFAQAHFPDARERCAWANQDCISLDGLPYVGRYSPNLPGVYVATGFNAWGMTASMVAADLLEAQLRGRAHPLEPVLLPQRSMLRRGLWSNLGHTVADYVIPTVRRCPHMGCALRYNRAEHSWDCPCHGSRFREDGSLLDTPAQRDAKL